MDFRKVKKVLFLQKFIWKIFFSNWISLRLYFLMAFDHAITARAISNSEISASHSQQKWDIALIHKVAVKIYENMSRFYVLLYYNFSSFAVCIELAV